MCTCNALIFHEEAASCTMKYLACAAALAASLTTAQAGGAVELSKDNFDSELAGKNAIVKFLAPVRTKQSM